MRLLFITSIIVSLLTMASARADFERAQKLYIARDYAAAWSEYLASTDDPRSFHVLGFMAERGQGTEKNMPLAAQFYMRGVYAHGSGMHNLVGLYGEGVDMPYTGVDIQAMLAFVIKEFKWSLPSTHGVSTLSKMDLDTRYHARLMLAELWAEQNGLLNEALCLATQYLKYHGGRGVGGFDVYGFILMRMNRLDEAEEFFRKSLALNSNSSAFEHMGDVAHLRGDDADAREWWRKALAWRIERHLSGAMTERLRAKLSGTRLDDHGQHPPFRLHDHGFSQECAVS